MQLHHGPSYDMCPLLCLSHGPVSSAVIVCAIWSCKLSTGYNTTNLFIDAEGTLGIVPEVTICITSYPPPQLASHRMHWNHWHNVYACYHVSGQPCITFPLHQHSLECKCPSVNHVSSLVLPPLVHSSFLSLGPASLYLFYLASYALCRPLVIVSQLCPWLCPFMAAPCPTLCPGFQYVKSCSSSFLSPASRLDAGSALGYGRWTSPPPHSYVQPGWIQILSCFNRSTTPARQVWKQCWVAVGLPVPLPNSGDDMQTTTTMCEW